ncbi:glycosyltransferase family 2 protein [Marinobacter daepoensis]|uniref:glycosyltransferase family 2 protein n=1 Tax=Marinobacter daepoensis TaxID=262077 RepID=UPI00041EDAD0|nr:glycosyltransferase family 2 protein [Marinobacter daepoensis]MBY6032525.1 glycosyltransferase family 2 protein [Marinobacter daepoensis]
MMVVVFWVSFLLLAYIYFGYPVLIKLLAGVGAAPVKKDSNYQPKVSILVAAYNEAKDIEATLRNKLALDYPMDQLEILVVSDESDDGTDEIVQSIAHDASCPVKLFRQVPRQGKTAGLNLLKQHAEGDILAFSDANSEWDSRALTALVSNFNDPSVGYVTGKMVYVNPEGALIGDGCSAYMKYENWLRAQETQVGSVVGVDGGIDAMRKELHTELRADQLPDFVQPLKVVEQGYRVVYEPEALLKEEALSDGGSEFSMRVRVSLRALWALKDMKQLMNPANYPRFAWQLISHKLLRYAAFAPMVTLAFAALYLAPAKGLYALAAIGYALFLYFAWAGYQKESQGQSLSIVYALPYYFVLLNLASFKAFVAFSKGEKKVVWNPRKG